MATNPTETDWPLKKPQQLVYVELGPHNGGMMLGVCEMGLTFRAVAPLKDAGPLPFSFALDGRARLEGVGELAWTEDDGKSGGLKFTEISPEFRGALSAWLAAEASPKNVGRETTPAATLPLDSIEKIKSHIRDGSVGQIRASAPIARAEEAVTPAKAEEATPSETKAFESKPLDERSAESESPGPKFRLPSAPSPAVLPSEPFELSEPPVASVAEAQPPANTSVEAQKEYPPLPGLHQPFAHTTPEEEYVEEPPRLNRTAAGGIIALALAVILAALLVSFRREVDEAMIWLGEKLSGENRAAVARVQPSEPATSAPSSNSATKPANSQETSPESSTAAPPHASEEQNNAQPADASPNARATTSSAANSSQSSKVQRIEDLTTPTDGGSGQREFEQARNILKGNHRQRDLSSAVDLLWTGVRKGYVPAEVTLADLYARGDGVDRSCEQARILLQAAIRKGSPEGRRRLAVLSRQGCT